MPQVINTNVASLNSQRNLNVSQNSLNTALQRLSSGLRINSAKDDAAGLAISERMSAQIRGLNQAARNANDGISLAQTAEGALGEIGNNLQRIRELAIQSANATNSADDRAALQKEVAQLKSEIDRVANQTSFNGTKLLDGSFANQAFQVGANQGQTINIAQIANAKTSELGNWISVATAASVSGGAAIGTTTPGATGSIDLSSVNTNGANGYDSFQITVNGTNTTVAAVAFDTDASTTQANLATAVSSAINSVTTGTTATANAGAVDLDNTTGTWALQISAAGNAFTAVNLAGETTTFDALVGNNLTINGVNIEVAASGSATQRASALVTAINTAAGTDPALSGVSASLVNGNLQLLSNEGDINIAGNSANLTALTGLTVGNTAGTANAYAAGSAQVGFNNLDISTVDGANNAVLAMDAALKSVNDARADLGAIQNRFSSVVANLNTTAENLSASRSRIQDTDFAAETAALTRAQILQQAGVAMLAQANALPNNVLSLLR